MNEWAVCSPAGEILRVYSGSAAEAPYQADSSAGEYVLSMLSDYDDTTAYSNGGEVTPKAELAFPGALTMTANGQDEAVITGIPAGVSVTWPDGQTDEVTDGEVRFSVDLPGTYRLKFTAVEYLDQEVTIEAVAAT